MSCRPLHRTLGIGFAAYSPLSRDFFTGSTRQEKNLGATEKLTALAGSKGATVAQLTLAWLLAQGDDTVPGLGTRSPKRVEENIKAADLTLSEEDLQMHDILPHGSFGARYAEALLPSWT